MPAMKAITASSTRWLGLGKKTNESPKKPPRRQGRSDHQKEDFNATSTRCRDYRDAAGGGSTAPVGPSRILRRIRRDQTAHVEGHALEMGNDQPSLLVPYRCEGSGRAGH